ncbi:hypothetical protein L208DRAFT_1284116 [Tricholoma matsutake]|nr:hypothetical protein L208DRAFT_1284116 [Tricholoma matsutake 945]
MPPGPDLKDAVAKEHPTGKHCPWFELDGKQIYKAQYLSPAFANYKKPGSTDRLKCVVNIQCYAMKSTNVYEHVLDHDSMSGANVVQMDSPIAILVHCSGSLFLCIGEVIDISVDSHHTDQVAMDYLTEPSVFILYQMLFLISATSKDDAELRNDWCWAGKQGTLYHVTSSLVQSMNPSISTKQPGNPFYQFKSSVLRAIGALILELFEQAHSISIPNIKKSD